MAPSFQTLAPRRVSRLRARLPGLWLLVLCCLSGCTAWQEPRYQEKYEIRQMTIVLMDTEGIQREWRKVSGKPAEKFITIGPDPSVGITTSVRGFYDYTTNTIYCPKMNFEVCGHELFHAIFGKFHPQ